MIAALNWPSAIVWVAVIFVMFGAVPLAKVRSRSSPSDLEVERLLAEQHRELLDEVQAMRQELAALRTEVAELDRVLKSVE